MRDYLKKKIISENFDFEEILLIPILATLLAFAFSGKLPIWIVYLMLSRDGIILLGAMLHLLLFENKQALPNRLSLIHI